MDSPRTEPTGAIEERNFIANMVRLRKARGWSQGELAARMNAAGWDKFHQTTVSRMENGSQPIRLGEARGIADVLGTKVDQMVLGDQLGERWRELSDATASLHLHGLAIGNAVIDYLDQKGVVRHLLGKQPAFPEGTPPSTVAEREALVEVAKQELAKSYKEHIDDVLGSGGDDGVDPEAS